MVIKVYNQDRDNWEAYSCIRVPTLARIEEITLRSGETISAMYAVRGLPINARFEKPLEIVDAYDPDYSDDDSCKVYDDELETLGLYATKARAMEVMANMVHISDQKPGATYHMPKE